MFFFWVIPWRLNFICRRFGTLCLLHLHRQVGEEWLNRLILSKSWKLLLHKETTAYNTIVLSCYPVAHPDTSHISFTYPPAAAMWVVTPLTTRSIAGPTPYSVTLRLFSSQTFSRMYTPRILKFSHSSSTYLWRWNRKSDPKLRHIKFRRQGITQKKTYMCNIQNTAKVWNQDFYCSVYLKKYWLSRFGASCRTRANLELNPRLIREDPVPDGAEWS